MDRLPRWGKRELICLLLFTCNYVVSVWRGFLFLCVLGMGYVILLWHSLSLSYNYIVSIEDQGYFFTIYFPGVVCFVLYYTKISGERLQDHWSSGSIP